MQPSFVKYFRRNKCVNALRGCFETRNIGFTVRLAVIRTLRGLAFYSQHMLRPCHQLRSYCRIPFSISAASGLPSNCFWPKLNIGEIALKESGQRLSETIAHWETIENPTVLSFDGIPA